MAMGGREEDHGQPDRTDIDRTDIDDQRSRLGADDSYQVGDKRDRPLPMEGPGPVHVDDRRDAAGEVRHQDRADQFVATGESVGAPVVGGTPSADDGLGERALIDAGAAREYRSRWADIQAGFVDQPRDAVAQADGLVSEIIQRVADSFARERDSLEDQWSRGDEVSTEDLRLVLQHYRQFFDRLLTT
jgi:hypothetical protein